MANAANGTAQAGIKIKSGISWPRRRNKSCLKSHRNATTWKIRSARHRRNVRHRTSYGFRFPLAYEIKNAKAKPPKAAVIKNKFKNVSISPLSESD